MSSQAILQAALSGFLIGSIYGLIALGLNVIFGTMRVINFAQGALLMVAMFISYWLWAIAGVSPYLSPFDLGAGAVCDRLWHPVFVHRATARSRQGARADERPVVNS